ncbi:MAG: hypothetical protein DMG97_35820 [Acidobacteria bacterium]|nr:MAG: hypothetical protein DMG97_35820 [Acidobacteriota bacterium]
MFGLWKTCVERSSLFFSTDKDLLLHVLSVHYYLLVNITLSVDDDIVRQARSRAKAMGKSVNQLVREYLSDWPANLIFRRL